MNELQWKWKLDSKGDSKSDYEGYCKCYFDFGFGLGLRVRGGVHKMFLAQVVFRLGGWVFGSAEG